MRGLYALGGLLGRTAKLAAVSDPAKLGDGLVRLGTSYVNWYLVADEGGVTVVDAGVPRYRPQLEPGLDVLGRSLEDIRAVLLTHSDGDHTGVANAVRDETGAPIHLHPGDEEAARSRGAKKTDEPMSAELRHIGAWRLFAHFTLNGGARPPVIDGTQSVADGETLDVPGRPRAIHTPGHTPGHVAYLFEGHGALFVGDLICTWHPTRGRLGPQVMAFNVSTPQSYESLGRIEDIDAALVLPGHGDPWREGSAAAADRARATAEADGRV
jgi:glyoxylase-like metal-dependent hydrolase (beta-lactamase superfamily II)